ncbi:MAG: glutamine--tRNA ligase [Gammaproteobacteria bacterium RIFCSPHIGHO2_12_FULL_41_15]|nr:MAG: glutamine--tRNA ligase [Gammaproteobacteria bacterium RIFCSPHIGHO2_12_FULL_41_15]
MSEPTKAHITNFIRHIIDEDLANPLNNGKVITRFPPEPNGYLHIGHAKAICLNFSLAQDYKNGHCYLRFDDTNPANENEEYMHAIKKDVHWLGFDWGEHLTFASDYFEKLYQLAVKLIKNGKAYVCDLSAEQVREYRGTLKESGKNSPFRDRSIEENLDLFERMKAGEFAEGTRTLRAKIDMSSGNMNMRDPALYRIKFVEHHRSGDQWCIYPMYDYTHPLSDALEGVTYSLCSLEFQDHRPLYDWVVEHCEMHHQPRQIEFSRLKLNYTITSKRYLKRLVEEGHVDGWDDPRMPTISGFRRRGYTPASIRHFCEQVGISKQDSITDMSLLEEAIRNDLNQSAERRNAVLHPIKVIITNYPEDKVEWLEVSNHPQKPELGKRKVPFTREIYIDTDDFMLEPVPQYFRLAPGKEVRLMNAYAITCREVITDASGEITALHCTYDEATFAGAQPTDGRKIKGTVHWLSATYAIDALVRIYDRLFIAENPGAEEDFVKVLNPHSLVRIKNAKVEASLKAAKPGDCFQFNRVGYFCADIEEFAESRLVFNRTVALRDTWKK